MLYDLDCDVKLKRRIFESFVVGRKEGRKDGVREGRRSVSRTRVEVVV